MSESFFSFRERMVRPTPVESTAPSSKGEPLSVAALTTLIERAIKGGLPGSVLVRGEVSNFNHHRGSGHLYFTLKDSSACIDCVMFKSDAARLKFTPADGLEMLVTGAVRVYAPRGRYQLYVTRLDPLGQGALELAFQQLRAKLEREGLFEIDRKKPLPAFPRRIAIITSRQTAALQDMLKVLRRFAHVQLSVFHVSVQGEGSAEQIASAIDRLSQVGGERGIDLILLGRGGGSLEDLWAFNEEAVARAMARCPIPIITGIGHEVDVSIADLVADYHAHTPTEAAQVAMMQWRGVDAALTNSTARLIRALRASSTHARLRLVAIQRHDHFRKPTLYLNQLRQLLDDRQRQLTLRVARRVDARSNRLNNVATRLAAHHPKHRVALNRQNLVAMSTRLATLVDRSLLDHRAKLDSMEKHLHAISPVAVLKRGYTITSRKRDGAILRSAADVAAGDRLVTRFADGTIESTAGDANQFELFDA